MTMSGRCGSASSTCRTIGVVRDRARYSSRRASWRNSHGSDAMSADSNLSLTRSPTPWLIASSRLRSSSERTSPVNTVSNRRSPNSCTARSYSGTIAAGRRAPAEQRELDVLEPVVELEGVEGQGRGLGCLARRRPEHLDLDRTPGRLADPELELQVDRRGLGHGLPLGSTRVSYSLLGSLGEDGRQVGKAGCHRPTTSGR